MLLAHGVLAPADAFLVHGSWLALPLSFAVGAAITLLLRGASALLGGVPGRRARLRPRSLEPRPYVAAFRKPRAAVIACHLAGRAPPSAVI